jgi:predicted phage terminase large subunit-like protein
LSDLVELLDEFPHLASPVALGCAYTLGKYAEPPHIKLLNKLLVESSVGLHDRWRVHIPFQFGKSWICSHFFPAWYLLLNPHKRFILCAYNDDFAATFGGKVKDIINCFGPDIGVYLKQDTRAKDEWMITGHDGGLVCRGIGSSVIGRPADYFLIEDPIKNAREAQSKATMQHHWDWYQTVAYSRLGPDAVVGLVMTRWGKSDLAGKIEAEAAQTGEKWHIINIPAIAEDNDPLGRTTGDPLWAERVPLSRLEMIRKFRPRWFATCWQQHPSDDESVHFRPRDWPTYVDMEDAFAITTAGQARRIYLKTELLTITTVDWAFSERKTADYTAIITFALTTDHFLFILEVVNRRIRLEALASELAATCGIWRPHIVAVEQGHPTLANEVRQHPEIPEVRYLTTGGKNKLARAFAAIQWGDNKRIVLPEKQEPWKEEYICQLEAFTGEETDEHDDMVDATSYGCYLAQQLRGRPSSESYGPDILVPGREIIPGSDLWF